MITVPKVWINDRVYIDGTAPSRDMMINTLMGMIKQALDESITKGKFRITE